VTPLKAHYYQQKRQFVPTQNVVKDAQKRQQGPAEGLWASKLTAEFAILASNRENRSRLSTVKNYFRT